MKSKVSITQKLSKLTNKIAAPVTAGVCAAMVYGNTVAAFAADSKAQYVAKAILGIIAGIVFVAALFFGIFGLIHYAAANAEGDGPAKHKAQLQIISAVMLLVVGTALSLPVVQNLVNYIVD